MSTLLPFIKYIYILFILCISIKSTFFHNTTKRSNQLIEVLPKFIFKLFIMNATIIEGKKRIIKALAEHIEKTKSPYIYVHYLKKETDIKSGSIFHGYVIELIQEGILEYVQSNNQNTHVMFTLEGKNVLEVGYSNYLNKIKETHNKNDTINDLNYKNQKFTYNWSYVLLIVAIVGLIITAFAYFKPLK